jgi:hypothetical protein
MHMAKVLIAGSRGDGDSWPVYLEDDPIRPEMAEVPTLKPPIAFVASWSELRALADQHGLEPDGDGYKEMEKVWATALGSSTCSGRLRLASAQAIAQFGVDHRPSDP